jgi:hypothetical protein
MLPWHQLCTDYTVGQNTILDLPNSQKPPGGTFMLAKLTNTERTLILITFILATLIVLVFFISTLGQYIESIQPTPTLRRLPAILTATSVPLPTLRPSSTPLPTRTPAVRASPIP